MGQDISAFQKHRHNVVVQKVFRGGAALLFRALILLFFGAARRYELAHLSIERLNRIKDTLSKFVPQTARIMIEANPDHALLDKYIRDAPVLFLDIEGFNTLVQTHPAFQGPITMHEFTSTMPALKKPSIDFLPGERRFSLDRVRGRFYSNMVAV